MLSLPDKNEIQSSFNTKNVTLGRQLLLQALQYGLESEKNGAEVSRLFSELVVATDNIEEHLVDALWLASSSLVEENTSKDESTTKKEEPEAAKDDKEELPPNGNEQKSNPRDDFVNILKDIFASEEEDDDAAAKRKQSFMAQLQSHLDPTILEHASLVASEKDLMKRVRMLNTKNYRQHKFNLLQEESEGFSKALESLIRRDYASLKTIMGTFHVDPNRILDLFLDVLIEETGSESPGKAIANLDWLKEYSLPKIPALLAFKLKHTADSAPNTNKILQTIASLAIQDPGILPLQKMTRYLEPIAPLLSKTFPLFTQIERKRVRSVGRVSLGGSSAQKQKEAEKDAQNQTKLNTSLKQLEKTHRIQLLNILLQERQWTLVQVLFPNETELKQVMTLFRPLGWAVCDWIHERLSPLYEKDVPLPQLSKQAEPTTDEMEIDDDARVTIDQLVEMVSGPLLCIFDSGCIAERPELFCQLCRILSALLAAEKSAEDGSISPSPTLYSFIQSFLLPSLSLFPANPSLSMEVWSVLKVFPYTTRYSLYRDWRGVGLEKAGLQLFGDKKKPLVLVESEMHAGKDARYVLKRLSKDTIRESCRQVAKVTHSNPLVMFTTVLNQIESYDNLVSVMVEALRFVSPLGLDVLGFCMLSRLCGSNNEGDRSRSKESGITVALWLQSMESFIGAFYERCPNVEFRGIVCYVMRRLRDGHVAELGVLRSLLKTTGGWSFEDYSPAASLSLAQLEGRAGSTLLKRETMTFGVVDKFNIRSSRQLRKVLQSEDIGVSLLILLAQVRSRIVFDGHENEDGPKKPVKLIGSQYDTTQVVMATLLDFLAKPSEKAQPVAAANKINRQNGKSEEKDSSKSGQNDELLKLSASMPKLVELIKTYGIDMATAWMLCRPLVRAAGKQESKDVENDPIQAFAMNDETRTTYKSLVPSESTWEEISPAFFEMFYMHTLYDLFCPENTYNTEVNRANKEVERLIQRQNQGGPQLSLQPGSVGGGPQQNPQEEIDRLKTVASTLSSQLTKQKTRVESVHLTLQEAAPTFFPKQNASISAVTTFLAECIFPRCMQGPDDAMYCAHFVFLLHKGETPGFSTLHYLDELVSVLSGSLFGVTEGEAANLSILLHETWKFVSRWRYDEKAFEEEVLEKPGSYMVDPVEDGTTSEGNIFSVSYDQYKNLFVKWHTAIGAAALGCLKSSEYMHTRASLIVLSRIVDVFPSRPNLGNKLFEVLEPLKSEENSALPDIRSAAQAYIMQLTKARTDGVWKEEDAAVVEARVKAEKEAQELRKRKAEEMFDDMKMESEKISRDIRTDDHGGRDRDRDRFGGRDRDRRGRPSDGRDYGRGGPGDGRRSPLNPNAPNFEPPPRVERERGGRATSSSHDHGRGRDDNDRRKEPDGRGGRSGGPVLGSLGRAETHERSRDTDPRGLEGRWEGSGTRGRGGKRGRSPSPENDRRDRGGYSSKRARTEDPKRSPDHRGGGGGGGRRRR